MRRQVLMRYVILLTVCVLAACAQMHPNEKPPATRDFIVFFSAESTVIDPIGQQVILDVAAAAKERSGRRLLVQAEASGDSAHAAVLAQQRTKIVAQALGSAGIAASAIDLSAAPRQPDQVGVIARRVTIQFEP